ncbi:hypothetical protein N9X23_02475 [Flavobacteriales bacterium]|nr:hypothetical protein [Flavobacteriales bacterium]
MKKIFHFLLIIPLTNWGQKVGDSICFKTIYNSAYYGTIEKIDSDGFFFKSKRDRVLYLKNSEINSFQTFPYSLKKEKKTNSSLKNLEYGVPKKISNVVKELENNLIDVNKLSSKIGVNVIFFLKDGRELKGEIIKVTYKIDVFGDQQEVIKFLNSNKKMNILTAEIEKVQEIK